MPKEKNTINTLKNRKHNTRIFAVCLFFFVIFSLIFASCKTTKQSIETTNDRHVVKKIKAKYIKNNLNNCYYKEKIVFEDTIKRMVITKEIKYYNCKGAYTYLVKSKKWGLVNNKLKKLK